MTLQGLRPASSCCVSIMPLYLRARNSREQIVAYVIVMSWDRTTSVKMRLGVGTLSALTDAVSSRVTIELSITHKCLQIIGVIVGG